MIPVGMDELNILRLRNNLTRFNNNDMGLVIAPTLQCNFNCPYCYVDRERSIMPHGVRERLKAFFKKKLEKAEKIELSWTGGEPLLAVEVIEELNPYFQTLAKSKGINIDTLLITNGYLLEPAMLNRLGKCGVNNFQISLDGGKEFHDRTRFRPGGGETYGKVLQNMTYAAANGARVIVRINITRENFHSVYPLIDELAASGIKKENCAIAPCRVIECNEGSQNPSYDYFSLEEFAGIEPDLLLYIVRAGFKFPVSRLTARRSYCGANTLPLYVIDPQANILKCWCNLGWADKNKVGFINEEGEQVITDHTALARWMAWDPFSIPECLQCGVLPLCLGGCMFHCLIKEAPLESACSVLKYNLNETLLSFWKSRSINTTIQ